MRDLELITNNDQLRRQVLTGGGGEMVANTLVSIGVSGQDVSTAEGSPTYSHVDAASRNAVLSRVIGANMLLPDDEEAFRWHTVYLGADSETVAAVDKDRSRLAKLAAMSSAGLPDAEVHDHGHLVIDDAKAPIVSATYAIPNQDEEGFRVVRAMLVHDEVVENHQSRVDAISTEQVGWKFLGSIRRRVGQMIQVPSDVSLQGYINSVFSFGLSDTRTTAGAGAWMVSYLPELPAGPAKPSEPRAPKKVTDHYTGLTYTV